MVWPYSVSVFFPAHNEEDNIADLAMNTFDYLKKRFDDFEILVISQGSTDKTNEIVLSLQREIPQLKLIANQETHGYAGALRTGFGNSAKELIFYTDGDNQFNIEELDKLLPYIETHDIVTGYKLKRCDPPMRSFFSGIYNLAMRRLFGLKVKDVNCAFKLYRREVIDKIDFIPELYHGVINAEIYLKSLRAGYRLAEVGVNHYPRKEGASSAEPKGFLRKIGFVKPKVVVGFLKDTIRLVKYSILNK